jgi:hypothetical protein
MKITEEKIRSYSNDVAAILINKGWQVFDINHDNANGTI